MRKNSLTRQVRRAYRQDELARICQLREDRFGRAFGMETVRVEPKWGREWAAYRSDRSESRPEDYYHFRDNNSSVLAVAHLDTVVSQKGRVPHFRNTEKGPLITSGALDDRLGAYVITSLLPKLGITCDWLLTVGEESGASTAEHFDPGGKKYDWVIEFDRGGTDVVMYQYEDRASERLLEAAGAVMNWGSFSDIAYLEHLGVKAFNWGVGYGGNYHSEAGYAYLNDTFSMVAKYLRFHEQNAGTRLPHDPDARPRYGSGTLSYSSGSYRSSKYSKYDDDDDYYGRCDSCGEENAVDSVTWYCGFCGTCQDCGATDPDVAAEWNDPDVDVCQCYAPEKLRAVNPDERQERDDWTGMTWSKYLARRPGKDSTDDDDDDDAEDAKALADAQSDAEYKQALADTRRTDSPAPDRSRISAAPPWSEHRPDVSHGLGVPTGRKPWNRELSPSAAAAVSLSGDLVTAVTEFRARSDQAHEYKSAVNPPAVFPDADLGWHAAAKNGDLHVVSHEPGQAWAPVCLRCAARWPHPVSGALDSRDIHPESDCPGCDRCNTTIAGSGLVHAIPAHLAGESDLCGLCRELNTGPDAAGAALRETAATLRALDE